jgi:hypothetical protein
MKCLRPYRLMLELRFFRVILVSFLAATPLFAKTVVDFNPNLDFSKYKTFSFIGGVENLVMIQVDPELLNDRIHRAVNTELTKKGLREIQPGQNPDLVVRYWANPSQQVNVATMGNWAPFGPYIDSYWTWLYNDVSSSSVREGALIIDLIDLRSKNLAWRLYLVHKITAPDKEWKKANEEITKAFDSFPPSNNEKEAKKKEWAAHPPKLG